MYIGMNYISVNVDEIPFARISASQSQIIATSSPQLANITSKVINII
jgi:hypothetical protein